MVGLKSLLRGVYGWLEANAVVFLFLVFTVPPLVILWAYVQRFRAFPISSSPEHWAWFGDFLAGALGPFVTLLTVLFLGIQLLHNKQVINLAAEELAASREALKATLEELQLNRSIQIKTEEALNKQIELTILAEGHRYQHGVAESAREAMVMASERSTQIAQELMGLGINVFEAYNHESHVPNEEQLRERYSAVCEVLENAKTNFIRANSVGREIGSVLVNPALGLARVYRERQANSPADASSPTQ